MYKLLVATHFYMSIGHPQLIIKDSERCLPQEDRVEAYKFRVNQLVLIVGRSAAFVRLTMMILYKECTVRIRGSLVINQVIKSFTKLVAFQTGLNTASKGEHHR